MISRSNPNVSWGSKQNGVKPSSPMSCQTNRMNEKGDAAATSPGAFELCKDVPRPLPVVRRQLSTPNLPVSKRLSKLATSSTKLATNVARPVSATSALPMISPKSNTMTTDAVVSQKSSNSLSSSSVNSNLSMQVASEAEQPICEALKKDPKLKALCISLGIDQRPNTLVGPIEKGQLIVGTLQESLRSLIRLKIRNAERKGEKFHIQQSGLDTAVRALKNAERSLKTIKESKQPILGKARLHRSSESLLRCHRKTTDAVIRILNSTKEKFDKMESGVGNRFLSGVSLVSTFSSSSMSPPSSTGFSGYATRRPSDTSVLTTPITPYSASTTTAACSRARTATSSTSLGGGYKVGSRGKLVSITE